MRRLRSCPLSNHFGAVSIDEDDLALVLRGDRFEGNLGAVSIDEDDLALVLLGDRFEGNLVGAAEDGVLRHATFHE